MGAAGSAAGAHEVARRQIIDVLVAQGLDDMEAARLDARGAIRLVAEIAWDEASRTPSPHHAVLQPRTSGGPERPASPAAAVAGPVTVDPLAGTAHRAVAVNALVVRALRELDAQRLTIVGALETVAASAWDFSAAL